MAMRRPPVMIVGCGPGAPEYLTVAAREAVEKAEVLVGAKRLFDLFPESKAERVVFGSDVEAVLDAIEERRDRRVAVLVTGDPGLSSLARPVLSRFGRSACRVICGISSVQVAFARLGLDWRDALILSAHGGDPDIQPEDCRHTDRIAILGGRTEAMRWMAVFRGRLEGDWEVFVCEDLTLDTERVRRVETAELGELEVSTRTIVLLIRKESLS